MFKTFSIAEARHSLAALVHQLERQPIIQLTRRGKPVAVLLSVREYQRLVAAKAGFWDAYANFRSQANLKELDIDPKLFDVREKSQGREFNW